MQGVSGASRRLSHSIAITCSLTSFTPSGADNLVTSGLTEQGSAQPARFPELLLSRKIAGANRSVMHLIQILLPLYDGRGRKISRTRFSDVLRSLTERFGGVTAYVNAPAEGQWKVRGKTDRDQIIIIEVMTDTRQARWWTQFRKGLETSFLQDKVIIRALECKRL